MKNIAEKITTIWRKIPRAIRSGWITAWVTFTGTLLTILVGLLPQLANAISSKNFEPFFDALSTSSTLAISASLGFVSGLVNALYRWARPIELAYKMPPANGNPDDPRDGGYVIPQWLIWFIALCVTIILVWIIFTKVIDVKDDDAIRAVLMH
jgi:hypothetical protein